MTPRGRVALIAVGVTVGILVLFIGTVLILMNAVSDEGLASGGPRVAVVEIEGIIVDGSSAVRELREHLENPATLTPKTLAAPAVTTWPPPPTASTPIRERSPAPSAW